MPARKCAKSFEPFPPPAGFSCLHIRFLISDRIRSNPFFTPNAPTPTFINRILVNGERVDLPGCEPPKVYPPCKQVYNTFARWRQRGVWDVLLALLRQQVRAKAGRRSKPSKAIN